MKETELRLGKAELQAMKERLRAHDRKFTLAARQRDTDALQDLADETDDLWIERDHRADELLRVRP